MNNHLPLWSVRFGNPRKVTTLTIEVRAVNEASARLLATREARRDGMREAISAVHRLQEVAA